MNYNCYSMKCSMRNIDRSFYITLIEEIILKYNEIPFTCAVCELYCEVPCEAAIRMYWAEEGQRLCPHHEAVTKLRTTIISHTSDTKSRDTLEQLYLGQSSSRW